MLKARTVAGLTAANPQALTPVVKPGAEWVRVVGISARNWASSAKGGAGADTAQKVKIVDADSRVVFLDAADRDYATAAVNLAIAGQDDTSTGLGWTAVDATGAAAAAGENAPGVLARTPLTVSILNGTTVTDYFEAQIICDVG